VTVATPLIEGPFLAICGLLAAAGGDKVLRPDNTARALTSAGIPARRWLVRAAAGVELAIGASAAITGIPILAALVATSYLVFAAFVGVALARHWPLASCGCFSQVDTPPSSIHVVMDVAAAGVAGGVAAGGGTPLGAALRGQPAGGVPLLAMSAAVAGLLFVTVTFAARLKAIRTSGSGA
jgi:hypothetical protein